mmetsp:Transcript_14866/g.40068  ORF Transcript_14866/g.40068 Transcript_14866/m.40068 type:complete len:212 (-) Transcript_14866:1515-2150(-)
MAPFRKPTFFRNSTVIVTRKLQLPALVPRMHNTWLTTLKVSPLGASVVITISSNHPDTSLICSVWTSVTSAILGEKGMGMLRGFVYFHVRWRACFPSTQFDSPHGPISILVSPSRFAIWSISSDPALNSSWYNLQGPQGKLASKTLLSRGAGTFLRGGASRSSSWSSHTSSTVHPQFSPSPEGPGVATCWRGTMLRENPSWQEGSVVCRAE